jgi:hypothetical protein
VNITRVRIAGVRSYFLSSQYYTFRILALPGRSAAT